MHLSEGFRLGSWQVDPEANRLTGPDGKISINARSMDVLCCLAEHAGEVVSRDDFADAVWHDTVVTDDALTWCISELRRKLDDSASNPRYIETIPKRGYRLIAPISPRASAAAEAADDARIRRRFGIVERAAWLVAGAAAITLTAWLLIARQDTPPAAERFTAGIAVLPLASIAESDNDLPLAEGLHQDLLARLSGVSGLRVISATSSRRYRNSDKRIPEIAAELDVDWVVEGAVQQWTNRFRVNVQLIDATHDTHRWARSYEDELTAERLFLAQSHIIEDIVESIETTLTPARPLTELPTSSLEAYALTVRANTLLRQRNESAMRQAGQLYERATELDPNYAEAWARRGDMLFLLHYYGHEQDPQLLIDARRLARRALALEPEQVDAMVVEALIAMRLDHDLPQSLRLARRALERVPEKAVGWLAWLEAVGGNLDRGLELTREQIRTTPYSPGVHYSLAALTLSTGNAQEALVLAERAVELSPAYASAWSLKGQALLLQDRARLAVNAFEEALTLSGRRTGARDLAWLALARERTGESVDSLVRDVMTSEDGPAKALVKLALDEPDVAVSLLRQSDWDDVTTLMVRYHPILEPLRHREGFSEILEDVDRWWGLPGED